MTIAQSIAFTIPGKMRGKQRAGRLVLPGGKVRSFNPKKTESLEAVIRHTAALEMRGMGLMDGPVKLEITTFMLVPKSWPKKKAGSLWNTSKPDWDNIGKLIADAMNGIVYRDDAQIVSANILKRMSLEGERTIIAVSQMGR